MWRTEAITVLIPGVVLDKGNISCHTSKQGGHNPQQLQPPWMVSWWALREFKMERISAIWQPSGCSHSPWWTLRKLKMWNLRKLAPDSWGTYPKNDFTEPRLLHFPIHRKALNSLTWAIWFSLIHRIFLMFRLPPFCCKLLLNLASQLTP